MKRWVCRTLMFSVRQRRGGKQPWLSLAQKMVGRACGVKGIRPGAYCEPKMTSVGSQDTTGPMTRDELKDRPVWDSPPIWSCSRSVTPQPIRSRLTSPRTTRCQTSL